MPSSKLNIHLFQLFPWGVHTEVEKHLYAICKFDELIIHRCGGGLSSGICEHLYFRLFHSNNLQTAQHICSECRDRWQTSIMPNQFKNNFRVNTLHFNLNQSVSSTERYSGVDASTSIEELCRLFSIF